VKVTPPAAPENTGRSFTPVTLIVAVLVACEYADSPPLANVLSFEPAVPLD
jgi:hypothetical protein